MLSQIASFRRYLLKFYKTHQMPSWVANLAGLAQIRWLETLEKRTLTKAEFTEIENEFFLNHKGQTEFITSHYLLRTLCDPHLVKVIKKLRDKLGLKNFVETGTNKGDTSFIMSMIFDHVYTCDCKDFGRRMEFYLKDNITYETMSSPSFLRKYLHEIEYNSLFYLDSHWFAYWPLRDELAYIFSHCKEPVILIDDFDCGNGLEFEAYGAKKLDFDYIADLIPLDYKFSVNTWSYRNKGMIILFPSNFQGGCLFEDRSIYSEDKHGLFNKA